MSKYTYRTVAVAVDISRPFSNSPLRIVFSISKTNLGGILEHTVGKANADVNIKASSSTVSALANVINEAGMIGEQVITFADPWTALLDKVGIFVKLIDGVGEVGSCKGYFLKFTQAKPQYLGSSICKNSCDSANVCI
jgi:hypothetical protein